MEIRHLKYFLAIVEELSFVKAAEKLFISQPPLSRQIKELELELGVQLFERNNKRVALTEAGKYFEQEAREVLRRLEAASIQVRKIGGNVCGEYNIAYISSTFSGSLTSMLSHLGALFPLVNFRLYEVPTFKQVNALELGKLDLAIVRAPIYSEKIKTEHWFTDHYSIVYSKDKYSFSHDSELAQLRSASFVFFNKDYAPSFNKALLEICAHLGFVPRVIHEANTVASIIQLVKNGLGVSILPSQVLKNFPEGHIGSFPVCDKRFRSEVLLATPKHAQNPVSTEAIKYLKEEIGLQDS